MTGLKAIFPESSLDEVISKMAELGIKSAYETFTYQGTRYMALYTADLTLYYYCKSLLSGEEQKFFY